MSEVVGGGGGGGGKIDSYRSRSTECDRQSKKCLKTNEFGYCAG